MSVFVDDANILWKNKRWYHLVATTEEELHKFARKLELKRKWYQPPNGLANEGHYDISYTKRFLAIKFGAVSVPKRKLLKVVRESRS